MQFILFCKIINIIFNKEVIRDMHTFILHIKYNIIDAKNGFIINCDRNFKIKIIIKEVA